MADAVKSIGIIKDGNTATRPIALSKSLTITYDKDYVFNGEEDVNLSLTDIQTKRFLITLEKSGTEDTPVYTPDKSFDEIMTAIASDARVEVSVLETGKPTYNLGLSSYDISEADIYIFTFTETEVNKPSNGAYITTNGYTYTHNVAANTDIWEDISCSTRYFRLDEVGNKIYAVDDLDMRGNNINDVLLTAAVCDDITDSSSNDTVANKKYVDTKFTSVSQSIPTFEYDETTQTLTITAPT